MTEKESKIKVEGNGVEALPGTQLTVEPDNRHQVLAYPSGKMRKYYTRLLLGDRVGMDISPQ